MDRALLQGRREKRRRGGALRALGASLFLVIAAFVIPFVAGSAAAPLPALADASDPVCTAAGTTGLTAALLAISGEKISGWVNATGCDVGIYVGPGVTNVHIVGAVVKYANDHGIFVQDTTGVTIRSSTIAHNGIASHKCGSHPCIVEDKAVELVGTTGVVVQGNVISHNVADGGIGVSDDGAIDPGAPAPGTPMVSSGNVIRNNLIVDDAFGCGIVLAAYNAGSGVTGNLVRGNLVTGSAPGTGPFVGGIVVAADAPGTWVWENVIQGNQIYRSVIPGIVVHSNTPGDRVWNNTLISNTMTYNGFQSPPNDPTSPNGIEVVAEAHPDEANPPMLTNTTLKGNTVYHDTIGVWLCDETNTKIVDLDGKVPIAVETC